MLNRDKLRSQVQDLERLITQNPRVEKKLEGLRDKYYESVASYNLSYPEDLADVLPTMLGNIIKAAENYPGERYGFDGVHFWPRFIQVIPNAYKSAIDNVRNELSFHVNMSMISILFSVVCVLGILFAPYVGGTGSAVFNDYLGEVLRYLMGAALGFVSSGFFYNASLMTARSFSLMTRSSSDLFRLELLKQLGMKRPKSSIEEFETWQNLNELVVLGSHSLTFKKLDYREDE
jgi:hypothetical protein